VACVQPDFLSNIAAWNTSLYSNSESTAGTFSTLQERLLTDKASGWDNLTAVQCIKRYSNPLSGAKDVVLVLAEPARYNKEVRETNDSTALVDLQTRSAEPVNQQYWLCQGVSVIFDGQWCGNGGIMPNLTNFIYGWGPPLPDPSGQVLQSVRAYTGRVAYCLSEGIVPRQEECGLHFSISLMAIVCGFNILESLCLLCVWWRIAKTPQSQRHLLTLGDAISSYLEIAPGNDLKLGMTDFREVNARFKDRQRDPRIWTPKSHRWAAAIHRRHWITVFIL